MIRWQFILLAIKREAKVLRLGTLLSFVGFLFLLSEISSGSQVFNCACEKLPEMLQVWRTNNPGYHVHFQGLTKERLFSGRNSFKLEVTVPADSYLYYHIPVKVFPGRILKFSAYILVEEKTRGKVCFGPGYSLVPDFPGYDGVNDLAMSILPASKWNVVELDIVEMGQQLVKKRLPYLAWGVEDKNVSFYLSGIHLYLESPPGEKGYFIVFLGDLKIVGESIPEDKWLAEVESGWQPARARIKEKLDNWEKMLEEREKILASCTSEEASRIKFKIPHIKRRIITARSMGFIPAEQIKEMETYFTEMDKVINMSGSLK